MTTERRRGGPFPDALEVIEARELGPYPTWRRWRHSVERRFDNSFKDGTIAPVEPILHELYVLRRLHQKRGEIDQDEIEKFWQKAEEQFPGFEERYGDIVFFIIDKTGNFGRRVKT